jgi:hypothetical protein
LRPVFRASLALCSMTAVLGAGCNCGGGAANDSGLSDSGGPGPDSGPTPDSGSDAGGSDAGGSDAGNTATVTATRVLHYLTDGTQQDVPANLSRTTIAAWVADPNADGGYDVFPGVGSDAGSLTVSGVPMGATYYLQVGSFLWIESSATSLDVSQYFGGHPTSAAGAGTTIAYALTGLEPWQRNSDFLTLASGGAGVNVTLLAPTPPIDAGATSYSGTFAYQTLPLINAASGDVTYLFQLSGQDAGRGASAAFSTSTFSVVDLATSSLAATFQALPQTLLQCTFAASQFDPLGSQVTPNPTGSGSQLVVVEGALGAGVYGIVIQSPEVFLGHLPGPTQTTDFSMAGTYGNPFAGNWALFGQASESWSVTHNLPYDGGTVPDIERGAVAYSDLMATFPALDGGTLAPLVSPPQSPTLDGQDWTVDQTLGSTTPLLSWSAPSVGTATYYVVIIDALSVKNGLVTRSRTDIYTTDTQVQLFPGVLAGGGGTYVMQLLAAATPNGNFAAAPLVGSFPIGSATALSGLLTTP